MSTSNSAKMVPIEDTVAEVIGLKKDDITFLDALYQWGMNPTCKSSGYGIERNWRFIEENLTAKYQSPKDVKEALVTAKGASDRLVESGHDIDELRKEVRRAIDVDKGTALGDTVLERIERAPPEVHDLIYIMKRYGMLKDHKYGSRPWDKAHFIEAYKAHLGPGIRPDLDPLIGLGLIVRLENHTSADLVHGELLVPPYLDGVVPHIDKRLSPSFVPKGREVVKCAFDRRDAGVISLLDRLARGQSVELAPESHEHHRLKGIIMKVPYNDGPTWTLLPLLDEAIKQELLKNKRELLSRPLTLLDGAMDELRSIYDPFIDITFDDDIVLGSDPMIIIRTSENKDLGLPASRLDIVITLSLDSRALTNRLLEGDIVLISMLDTIPSCEAKYRDATRPWKSANFASMVVRTERGYFKRDMKLYTDVYKVDKDAVELRPYLLEEVLKPFEIQCLYWDDCTNEGEC